MEAKVTVFHSKIPNRAGVRECRGIWVLKLLVFAYCDTGMREKDWCCRKRGMQAT